MGEAQVAAFVGCAAEGEGCDVVDAACSVVVRWEGLLDVLPAEPAVGFGGEDCGLCSAPWSAAEAWRAHAHQPPFPRMVGGISPAALALATRFAAADCEMLSA